MYLYKKYLIATFILLLALGCFNPTKVIGQTPNDTTQALETDSIPEIDMDTEEDELLGIKRKKRKKKKKKKKRDKKRWFGFTTKKTYLRNRNRKTELEIIRYLSEWPDLEDDRDKYVQEFFYYDVKRRRIRSDTWQKIKARRRKGNTLYLLHGLYRKQNNRKLREKGYFYMGMKHKTWEKFDKNYILLTKKKYEKGWLRDSKFKYFDGNGKKLKEVLQMHHKTKHGKYYAFYNNGRIAVKGEYEYDKKIKRWTHYYKWGNRKKMVQYPNRFYQKNYGDRETPFDLYRWNKRGKQTYDYTRNRKGKK